ncbi:hypothetical protein ONZ43_g1131 [Nemania bipapillata]|uniref:Uncharacterized protein n=1 Tax=Nemania bipapillata TaxID=110536 RepID=A0ACC2J5I4_9PEZI|nr:hypothetical protein ONZ43_g1131 [Nemania bipapillata]
MRFGQNFHNYVIPEWDGLYIDYSGLKQQIKSPLVNDSRAKQSVVDALSRLHSSQTALYLSLIQRHDLLFSHLGIQLAPSSALAAIPTTTSLPRRLDSDIHDYIVDAATDIRIGLKKLLWFECVNDQAADRILAKLRKSCSHPDIDIDAVQSEWYQTLAIIDQLRVRAQKLELSLAKKLRSSKKITPLLSVAAQMDLFYDLDATLVATATHASPSALKDYLDQNQDLDPDFHRSLFKRLVLRHSWECLVMLAPRFASSLDHHCLAVLFCSLGVSLDPSPENYVPETPENRTESISRVVCELFVNEPEKTAQILCQANAVGHTPLHYAMRVGLDISTVIRSSLDERKSHDLLGGSMLLEDKQGLTPLHLATIERHTSVVMSFFDKLPVYLRRTIRLGDDTLVDCLSNWADTKYRGARGHLSMVELLLKAGANPSSTDESGWTARKRLMNPKAMPPTNSSNSAALAIASCDPSEHTLVIYLGSMQLTNDRPPVQLVGTSDELPLDPLSQDPYRLELSVNQTDNQSQTTSLPFLEYQRSKPLIFELDAETEPQLLIKLFGANVMEGSYSIRVGAGAISLQSTKALCGHQRESLVRERTIILLSPNSQEVVGTVLVTYIIARPFEYLQTRRPMLSPASHERGQMTLVGHRGFGQNVADRNQLQLGENTIGSFLAAADHGATFVEYKYASSVQTPYGNPLIAPEEQAINGTSRAIRRSRSFDGQKDVGAFLIRDRLKHTVDFKAKAMKPNTRGAVIQEPLVTLPELFQKLPPSLGFNIEIKYPRIHEANDAGVAPIALEINLFVDTILEQIHRFADQRPIILSSFTPEICILLSIKQKAYPVLFISNAGKLPTNDFERRVASVQAGVHFAKTWGLAGLCLASEPLMLCPELIGDIKRSGLLCASYGPQNSVPENVLIQRDAGLDMIMVDKVALIARTLKQ